jgi:type IV pilus assembly protein PilW
MMPNRQRMTGLSLVEMMIALVMALIVAAGVISVFMSTSGSNQVQTQLAKLQEAGRFAIHSLRTDLANANGAYCSNSGGSAATTASGLYLDALRAPTVYAKDFPTINKAFDDNTTPLAAPDDPQAFSLPSFVYMRGYACTLDSCAPSLDSIVPADIPAAGTSVGTRVKATDVLTVRYLQPGSGWAIEPNGSAAGSTIDAGSDGTVTSITLKRLSGEPPVTDFHAGDLAMLADCNSAQVFAATDTGTVITPTGANFAQPLDISQGAAPRLFDFNRAFQTVTYFVKVVGTGDGHTTGELVRRVDGRDQPLVRGVERLNFNYGIIDSAGKTQFLTAEQVDTGDGGALACPPGVSTPGGLPDDAADGCLWRAVQTIQVHLLIDGQTPLYSLTAAEMGYIYSPDDDPTLIGPSAHAIKPRANQGFPKHLLRREFTTVVSLRNFNP